MEKDESENSVTSSVDDFAEPDTSEEEDEDADREAIRQRLYAFKKPIEKAKKPPPKLEENQYKLLKEHVRMLNGKSPRLIRKPKVICRMDSPEIYPKTNWTAKERYKHVRDRLEYRKDSEEEHLSSRCVN